MTKAARAHRMRLLIIPVCPDTGELRWDAPVIVYTTKRHRFFALWKRLCRLNGGKWPVVTPGGFSRYRAEWMTEDHYQSHRPQGPVVYRDRADRIVEKAAGEKGDATQPAS